MIDQIVEGMSEEFLQRVQAIASASLAYQYNYGISSLSLLDLYFQPQLYKGTQQQLSEDIVLASAHLGCICYRLLSAQSAKVNVIFVSVDTENNIPEVRLKIISHPKIENWEATINITDALIDCFSASVAQKPYALEEIIPFGLKTKPLFYHAFGLISGLHPKYKHKKAKLDEEALAPHLDYICENGANEMAQIFSLHAPGKERLLSPALFKRSLIFPPPGYKEYNLGERFLATFSQVLLDNTIQDSEIPGLTYILLESPYLLHFLAGAIYAAAFAISSEQQLLNELNEELPLLAPSLVKNILTVMKSTRKLKSASFPEILHMPEKDTTPDILIPLEQMGFFPLLYCTNRSIMSELDFRMYFELVCNGLLKEAVLLGTSYLARGPKLPLEIALQHAFILFEINEMDSAFDILKTVGKVNSENKVLAWANEALETYHSVAQKKQSYGGGTESDAGKQIIKLLNSFGSIGNFAGKTHIARRLLILLSTVKIDQDMITQLSKLANEHPAIISCKALYIMQSNGLAKENIPKVPSLRRAHWNPYRFYLPPNNTLQAQT